VADLKRSAEEIMGIDLQWESERSNVLERISDEQGLVAQILAAAIEEGSFCLRFVDPYGDTVFNQQQIRVLIDELRAVPLEHLSADAKSHLEKVVGLATRAQSKVHTYLKFYGD
jgi:hypothetical protein